MRALALLLLPLVGCLTENNYGDALQDTWCERAEACDPSVFEQEYGSQAECRSRNDDDVQAATECFAVSCEAFDAAAAGDGIDDVRSASCTELGGALLGAIEGAYQDCNNVMLLSCLGG